MGSKTDKILAPRPLPYFWPGVLVLALGACMLALFATSGPGIGVSPDSVFYLEGAQNLLAGRGYTSRQPGNVYAPITHWPPGYSLTLAAFNFGGEMLDTARRLNALLFGFNVLLVGVMVRAFSRRDWAGLLAAALLATAPPLLELHSTAWSEPLFFALALGACACLASFRKTGRWAPLLLAAALAGLSVLVRFAGAALVAAMLCALVAMLGSPSQFLLKKRMKAAAFTLVALLPMGLWLVSKGSAGESRKFGFLGMPTMQHATDAAHSLSIWLLPEEAPVWLRGGLLIVATLIVLLACAQLARGIATALRNNHATDPADSALRFIVLFAICYSGLVLASVMFFDPEIVFDSRTLSPLFLCAAITLPLAASKWSATNRRAAALLATFVVATSIGGTVRCVLAASELSHEGSGLNSTHWRQSAIIARLKALPEHTLVFTNEIAAVRFLTRCDVLALPPVLTTNRPDGNPPKVHPEYLPRMRKVLQTVTSRGGAVATFSATEWYYGLPEDMQSEILSGQLPSGTLDGLLGLAQGGELAASGITDEGAFYIYAAPNTQR